MALVLKLVGVRQGLGPEILSKDALETHGPSLPLPALRSPQTALNKGLLLPASFISGPSS